MDKEEYNNAEDIGDLGKSYNYTSWDRHFIWLYYCADGIKKKLGLIVVMDYRKIEERV